MAIQKDIEIRIPYVNNRLALDAAYAQAVGLQAEIGQYVNVDNAYCVVSNIHGDKHELEYEITVYEDNSKTVALHSTRHSFVPDVSESAINYHTQCYNHAKTLDEYIGAIDC